MCGGGWSRKEEHSASGRGSKNSRAFEKGLVLCEVGGPLAQGFDVGASGQDAGDHDLENDQLGVADPPTLAGIREGGEPVPKAGDAFQGKGIERDGHGRVSCQTGGIVGVAENLPSLFGKEPDPDGLGLSVVVIGPCPVPESAALPQAGPAGRLVAGAGKPGGVDESLDHVQGVAMDPLPVGGKPPDRQGQDLGGQVPDPCGRKDEIADVVGQIGQTAGLLLRSPSDKALPERSLQGGASPSQKGDPFPVEKSDMSQGLPGHPAEGKIVVLPHEGVPSLLLPRKGRTHFEGRETRRGRAIEGAIVWSMERVIPEPD